MALTEFSIIQRYFSSIPRRDDVLLGVGDDAALLQVPEGMQLLVSVDTLVEGRHFPENTAPEAVGHKALAVNLSDMAAMGADPAWATLAITLPDARQEFVEEFARGFFQLAQRYGVELVGGDTVRGPMSVTVQMHGLVPAGQAILRSGARPGDHIFVTGKLGDAGAGLALRLGESCSDEAAAEFLIKRLDYPYPRLEEGKALRGIASAAIDISDGLLADLGHILERSGCAAELELERLPLSDALTCCVSGARERMKLALSAGDDYELCFTVPEAKLDDFIQVHRDWEAWPSYIGRIVDGEGIRLVGEYADALQGLAGGFDHFKET